MKIEPQLGRRETPIAPIVFSASTEVTRMHSFIFYIPDFAVYMKHFLDICAWKYI